MRIIPLGTNGDEVNGVPEPSGIALFFEIDDTTLARVESDPNYFMDRQLLNDCFRQKGRNAHLYLLVNGGENKDIEKRLKFLDEEYESVSWWTIEQRKFFISRRKNAKS